MNVSKPFLSGIVVVLAAMLILSSVAAAYFYEQEQTASSQSQTYVSELNSALLAYRSLSGNYNSSLADYNATLNLLAVAVSNLNTSTPSYQNASLALPTLWRDYQRLASTQGRRVVSYSVHLLVDYGNGTKKWYNDTRIQAGWNGYVASLVLLKGNVQATWYPAYGEHFITGINGVASGGSNSWFVWSRQNSSWALSQTGVDGIPVVNGTAFALTLCGYDMSYNPTCTA